MAEKDRARYDVEKRAYQAKLKADADALKNGVVLNEADDDDEDEADEEIIDDDSD